MKWENLKILIIFSVVLLFCNQTSFAWRAFKVYLNTFTYEFNDKLIDAKIQVLNNTGSEPSLNVVLNVLEDMDNISLKYALAIEGDQPNNYTTLIHRNVHFCKFLQNRIIDNVLRIMYEHISKQSTFIKLCPLAKGSVFTLSDYRVDEELLPQYVPEVNFYVDMELDKGSSGGAGDVGGDMILKGRLYGKIDKSKGFHNLKMFSMG